MDDLAVGPAFRQRVEVDAGPSVVGERIIEMLAIALLDDERQERP